MKKYQYVALVRVKTLDEFVIPGGDSTHNRTAKITVDVIENFKNSLPTELILESYGTSCDIGLSPNEEWLIFAREYGSYATIFACDYSVEYERGRVVRDLNQLRSRSGDELLNTVRQLTGKPIRAENGRLEKFYANGQRALLTTYRDGGREEERLLWHENGRPWGKEFYKNGVKNGPALWWNANGTPHAQETFMAGVVIDTSRYWYETDSDMIQHQTTQTLAEQARDSIKQVRSRLHLRSIVIADRQGRHLSSQQFGRDGRLTNEVVAIPDANVACSTSFDRLGKINSLMVFRLSYTSPDEPERHLAYELSYQEDGSRRGAYYDNKGRLTRYTLVRDGIETVLEEKYYPD